MHTLVFYVMQRIALYKSIIYIYLESTTTQLLLENFNFAP